MKQEAKTVPEKEKDKAEKIANPQIVDCSTPEGRERFKAMMISKGWKAGKIGEIKPGQG